MPKAEDNVVISKEEYEDLLSVKHQLSELQRMIFGARSERFIANGDENQLALFEAAKAQENKVEKENISYEREKQKKKPVRTVLPANLPREEEIIEPEFISEEMKKIGEEITEILEHIPGKLFVRRIVRPKYVIAKQEKVVVAPLPTLPLPKANAGAGLLAHIQVSKFVDHLPFYRQVQMFKREGIKIAESTINGWFKNTTSLLEPLYERLVTLVQEEDYLQADESPIPVQSNQKKGATHTGYHWVYHAPIKKLAVFDYQQSRSGEGPKKFLKSFKGDLQTDGYAAYNEIGKKEGIALYACMAHARRYFDRALDVDKAAAEYALKTIQELYALERTFVENQYTQEKIYKARQKTALPILEEWKDWLDKEKKAQSEKSPMGKAINYTLGLWSKLIRYTDNPKVFIDNNKIENLIRPLAIGRKNYMFAGSHNAAQRAAMMYSFFASCKLNDLNPHAWLKDVLEKIPDTSIQDLDALLPHNWSK